MVVKVLDFDCEVRKLSHDFFKAYPHESYHEIERKEERPYSCLLIDTHEGYFICVPFRTNITHRYAFHFKNTQRSKDSKSGLDYTKIVIIKELSYIDSNNATVDNDEYVEAMENIKIIAEDVNNYVTDYINHISNIRLLHKREFSRRYRYSTLPYFHDLLGLK